MVCREAWDQLDKQDRRDLTVNQDLRVLEV